MMPMGLWVVVAWMAFVIFTGIVFLVWGYLNGQFDDIEEAKYKMLEEREPEGWPGREGGKNDSE